MAQRTLVFQEPGEVVQLDDATGEIIATGTFDNTPTAATVAVVLVPAGLTPAVSVPGPYTDNAAAADAGVPVGSPYYQDDGTMWIRLVIAPS